MNEFTLYTIFQSGMVLQREKPIVIWGNAPFGSQICVSLSASENSKSNDNGAVCSEVSAPAHADAIMCTYATAENTWQCTLPPQTAGENLILTATCAITIMYPLVMSGLHVVSPIWNFSFVMKKPGIPFKI